MRMHCASMLERFAMADEQMRNAILEGYASAAGLGNETLVAGAREALGSWLQGDEGRAQQVLETWMAVMTTRLSDERVAVALLELLAFVGAWGIYSFVRDEKFRWRGLVGLVMKAHYKSGSIARVLAAVACYGALGEVEAVRDVVRKKVSEMGGHPWAKVRVAVGEVLWTWEESEEKKSVMKEIDWSAEVGKLKDMRAILAK